MFQPKTGKAECQLVGLNGKRAQILGDVFSIESLKVFLCFLTREALYQNANVENPSLSGAAAGCAAKAATEAAPEGTKAAATAKSVVKARCIEIAGPGLVFLDDDKVAKPVSKGQFGGAQENIVFHSRPIRARIAAKVDPIFARFNPRIAKPVTVQTACFGLIRSCCGTGGEHESGSGTSHKR